MFWLHEDLSTMTANYLDMSNPSHLMMVADDVAVWQHPNHNSLVVVLFFLCVVVTQSPVKEELQLDNISHEKQLPSSMNGYRCTDSVMHE